MGEKRGTKGLELWCKKICENYDKVVIKNMTTSWRDGLAFCAIIHHFRPDLMIEFDKLNKDDIYYNCDLAFNVAEKYLNIPALLDPADMVQFEVPDRLSVLTYLSQYYQVFGAQDSSSKKTTPKDDANKDDSTSSSSTSKSPLQMAAELTYGVPKREPCNVCNFPVFLAERFKIGRKLYHRTCLKCVHCKEQLTPTDLNDLDETANIVGEFTCETCQDRIINESLSPSKGAASMFNDMDNIEDDDDDDVLFGQLNSDFDMLVPDIDNVPTTTTNYLKRSLSDEEKSKSLQFTNKKSYNAMNDFLSTQCIDTISNTLDSGEGEVETSTQAPKAASEAEDNAQSTIKHDQLDKGYIAVHLVDDQLPSISQPHLKIVGTATDVTEPEFVNIPSSNVRTPSIEIVLEQQPNKSDDECLQLEQEKNDDANSTTDPTQQNSTPALAPIAEVLQSPATPVAIPNTTVQDNNIDDDEESSDSDSDSESESESSLGSEAPDTNEVSNYTKASTLKLHTRNDNAPSIPSSDYPVDLNPFGEIDEEEEETPAPRKSLNPFGSESEDEEEVKVKPSRPPPPKLNKPKNPFESDEDEEPIVPMKTPVPTPRKTLQLNDTPSFSSLSYLDVGNSRDSFKGSTYSLNSNHSSTSTTPRRKGKAPAPPRPLLASTPSNLAAKTTPRPRKNRPAPAPPQDQMESLTLSTTSLASTSSTGSSTSKLKRLIPVDTSLFDENGSDNSQKKPSDLVSENVYRRQIMPLTTDETTSRMSQNQLEKIKDNKDAKNRDRQSTGYSGNVHISSDIASSMRVSSTAAIKHRKGLAPLPVPPKRILQMLPLQEIRHELEVIEVQHLGLEKQGVTLEKMIRERCETEQEPAQQDGPVTENAESGGEKMSTSMTNSVDVDDLIMQLFEIVNEKNELFRRQAELMYLRRSHRLEQEQVDLEYEVRKSMAQPERNKTDSDKSREENLIARLVEVVQQRNEIIECLEMDRVRERDEDTSIKEEKEKHAAKRDEEYSKQTLIKLSKKEKKSQKESKKFFLRSSKKVDTEKETDESEQVKTSKKKKKKFLF